jgi:thiamine biosynthesis lipoprotein
MGTTAEIVVVGGSARMSRSAEARIGDLERRWSRIRPSSEVCRLNAADGAPTPVSAETVTLLRAACDGYEMTGGRFDPFPLDAVRALGSWETMRGPARAAPATAAAPLVRAIRFDHDASEVTLPRGLRFDPTGIAKGCAADLIATELVGLGAEGVCVNLGGDIRVMGDAPTAGDAWLVAVRDAAGDAATGQVAVADRGIATTTGASRLRSTVEPLEHGHAVDRATARRPTAEHAVAIATDAWRAAVLSAVVLHDPVCGVALAERLGATALAVTADGTVVGPGWARYARPKPAAGPPR